MTAKDFKEEYLRKTELSKRIISRLAWENYPPVIKTTEQLAAATPKELMGIRNFGKQALKEVIAFLKKRDVALQEEEEPIDIEYEKKNIVNQIKNGIFIDNFRITKTPDGTGMILTSLPGTPYREYWFKLIRKKK